MRLDRVGPQFFLFFSITDLEWAISPCEPIVLRVWLVPVERDRFYISITITFRTQNVLDQQRHSRTTLFRLYSLRAVVLLNILTLYLTIVLNYCRCCSILIKYRTAHHLQTLQNLRIHFLSNLLIFFAVVFPRKFLHSSEVTIVYPH